MFEAAYTYATFPVPTTEDSPVDNKSPILLSYLNKIDPFTYPSPLCPLCKKQNHDTTHLFNCPLLPTNLVPMDLWLAPERVAALLAAWERVLSDS